MAAGWNLKYGVITNENPSDDELWAAFNYVFSPYSSTRSYSRIALIKAMLDSLLEFQKLSPSMYKVSYKQIFSKFAENYWNLVNKYHLKQMRPDGKSEVSKIEEILQETCADNNIPNTIEYDSLSDKTKKSITNSWKDICSRNVGGALYNDTNGVLYAFDKENQTITMSLTAYTFLLRHKMEIEKLNYYAWARFLASINADEALIRVIEKLELATPRRNNLSVYSQILFEEFQQDTCFYCGKKLTDIHVDHFIPWSYVKTEKLWHLVLACPKCNTKKRDRLPNEDMLKKITQRNENLESLDNKLAVEEFDDYSEDMINKIYYYAKICGLKQM